MGKKKLYDEKRVSEYHENRRDSHTTFPLLGNFFFLSFLSCTVWGKFSLYFHKNKHQHKLSWAFLRKRFAFVNFQVQFSFLQRFSLSIFSLSSKKLCSAVLRILICVINTIFNTCWRPSRALSHSLYLYDILISLVYFPNLNFLLKAPFFSTHTIRLPKSSQISISTDHKHQQDNIFFCTSVGNI